MPLLGRRKGPRVFFLTKCMPKEGGNAYEFYLPSRSLSLHLPLNFFMKPGVPNGFFLLTANIIL